MQNLSKLSIDDLLETIYVAIRKENERQMDMNGVVRMSQELAHSVWMRVEPLSESALGWLQHRDKSSVSEFGGLGGELRDLSLSFSLEAKNSLGSVGSLCIEESVVFRADERREGRGEVDFIQLTLCLYTMMEQPERYQKAWSSIIQSGLNAAKECLRRKKTQCQVA